MSEIVSSQMAEALETPNELFTVWEPRWTKAQDVKEGEDTIKEKGTDYLPKTSLMELLKNGDDLYEAYKLRSSFFNGTSRTVDGLLGLVFRKDPVYVFPETIKDWENNINMHNQSLTTFSKKVLEQVILKNRVGLFVDYPVKKETLSVSQAESLNMRPFVTMYPAECIMDWDEERIDNIYKTSYVMLSEIERKREDLTVTEIERRRVLDLFAEEEGSPRYYRQRVFEQEIVTQVDEMDKETSNEQWVLKDEFYPTNVKGERFTEIPFCALTDRGISWDLDSSMIYDLVNVNISLYRNSADYENILHVGTNPTPCAKGLNSRMLSNPNIQEKPQANEEQVSLGLNTLLEFDETGTSWMLEASGNGAASMSTTMDSKKQEMALLGGRILASDSKGVETAEVAQLHKQGEQGVLASAVSSLDETIEKVLITMYEWHTGSEISSEEVDATFNKDYMPGKVPADIVTTALQALQAGQYSSEEMFEMLQTGEWIKAEKSFEDHQKEVANTLAKIKTEEDPFKVTL